MTAIAGLLHSDQTAALCSLSQWSGRGVRTHAMPGWKPGAYPLGDARSKMVQGVGVEPTTSRLSIARSAY